MIIGKMFFSMIVALALGSSGSSFWQPTPPQSTKRAFTRSKTRELPKLNSKLKRAGALSPHDFDELLPLNEARSIWNEIQTEPDPMQRSWHPPSLTTRETYPKKLLRPLSLHPQPRLGLKPEDKRPSIENASRRYASVPIYMGANYEDEGDRFTFREANTGASLRKRIAEINDKNKGERFTFRETMLEEQFPVLPPLTDNNLRMKDLLDRDPFSDFNQIQSEIGDRSRNRSPRPPIRPPLTPNTSFRRHFPKKESNVIPSDTESDSSDESTATFEIFAREAPGGVSTRDTLPNDVEVDYPKEVEENAEERQVFGFYPVGRRFDCSGSSNTGFDSSRL